ncbi:MAG: phytochelatin synthase [Desulfobacter sp.]|nr:phytochelatin synthase [Desulfobacter sp.]WDP87950.1 MAG: phytochelatin synthase [Desulfobacter sp.]
MLIYRYTMRTVLIVRYFFHWLTRTGCFGRHQAVLKVPGPKEKQGKSLRAGLYRHHVKQFHDSSCSVASVASIINTLLEKRLGPGFTQVTQQNLLDQVTAAHWKERMGPQGYKGRRGLPLNVLGRVVAASLDAYGIFNAEVEVIKAKRGAPAKEIQKRLGLVLEEFQVRDNCLVIAHFDQGSFIRELNIPHISPVGQFDPQTRRVTILDVDPAQTRPYTLSFHTFYKGISTCYGGVFSHFGYGRGGVVVVRLNHAPNLETL